MKLTVLKWLGEFLVSVIAKTLEIGFRTILFILPLGVYLTLLQFRKKTSSISNISVYTTDKSVWQHIFPGFILVAKDSQQFKTYANNLKNNFQSWVNRNKYTLAFIFMCIIVYLMIIKG